MRMHWRCVLSVFLSALTLLIAQDSGAQQKPWPVRAVIVTTFEIGADTGDAPGEFQFWVEREHLTETVDFPGGVHPLRANADHTVLGMVSGTTLVNATASMMALGMDPRFDLTHAYFLINGIAGGDPQVVSLGSAVWTDYVLNDVSREIDSREAPAEWAYGIFPVNTQAPNPISPGASSWFASNVYPVNARLTAWAFAQTKGLKLGDDAKAAAFRAGFTGFPNALRPPFVLVGATLASNRYWHGTVMTEWARDWVRLFTGGKGTFATTEMEDSGFMAAVARLAAMHRVDGGRVMVLRAVSNYSEERPGQTAIQSVAAPYAGSRLALEAAYLCGSTVLHGILSHWDTTYGTIPGE